MENSTQFDPLVVIGVVVTAVGVVVAAIGVIHQIFSKTTSKAQQNGTKTSIRQKSGSKNIQIGEIQGDFTINPTTVVQPQPPPGAHVDIFGRWNLDAAVGITKTILTTQVWKSIAPEMSEPLSHELVDDYSLVYKDKEGIVLVFSTITEGHDCHACAPYLSFFEFEKRDTGWELITSDVGVCKAGSWGKPPALSVEVVAENKYGVFMRDGYTAQGWSVSGISIHTRIGDAFVEILSLISAQSDPNGRGWNSKIAMRPTSTGIYDLDVQRWGDSGPEDLIFMDGNPKSKLDVSDEDGRVRPYDLFKFDGKRFARNSTNANQMR